MQKVTALLSRIKNNCETYRVYVKQSYNEGNQGIDWYKHVEQMPAQLSAGDAAGERKNDLAMVYSGASLNRTQPKDKQGIL